MIHDEHPFADPEDLRDPARRFRGRLSAPVTLVTAGTVANPAGLTVSSLVVAEGEPSRVFFLCGTGTDLWYAIGETGAFIVHVLEESHREISDRFAGLRPSPGGLFRGLDPVDTEWGPLIPSVATRAFCRFTGHTETDIYALVDGVMEKIDLSDITRPLQYFRGRYLRAEDQ
ncbi:MAG: flavin reductase family protein [Actinomycetota bacterium]|nr:flavin reductase family protein [Actinomycetota bacterium]